ncbi:MAG: SGNH/GDSL hydrolase family protein [Ilumatobacteraceae bacterium]
MRGGEVVDGLDHLVDACAELLDAELPAMVAAGAPDVVLAMVTLIDVVDRVWVEGEEPLTATVDRFVDRLSAEYTLATQRLLDEGVGKVLWVAPPVPELPPAGAMARAVDPLIRQRYREVLAGLESTFPGRAVVVDLAAWMASAADPPDRKDGLHYSEGGARELADRYLGPVVVAEAVS